MCLGIFGGSSKVVPQPLPDGAPPNANVGKAGQTPWTSIRTNAQLQVQVPPSTPLPPPPKRGDEVVAAATGTSSIATKQIALHLADRRAVPPPGRPVQGAVFKGDKRRAAIQPEGRKKQRTEASSGQKITLPAVAPKIRSGQPLEAIRELLAKISFKDTEPRRAPPELWRGKNAQLIGSEERKENDTTQPQPGRSK